MTTTKDIPAIAEAVADRQAFDRVKGRPITFGQLDAVLAGVGKAMREHLLPLQERIAALETQQAEMMQRGIRFRGAYQRALASQYRTGDVVVHAGTC